MGKKLYGGIPLRGTRDVCIMSTPGQSGAKFTKLEVEARSPRRPGFRALRVMRRERARDALGGWGLRWHGRPARESRYSATFD
jgi:hypothetical protein